MPQHPALGRTFRDIITNLEGVCVVRCESLTSTPSLGLQPEGVDDKGQPYPIAYFDEARCEQQDAPPLRLIEPIVQA